MPVRYHLLSVLCILAVGLVGGLATPLTGRWDGTRVMHSWSGVPEHWEVLGHPPADTTIDLYLALKPQHENAVIDALLEVSNPRHPKYGAFLSKEQVAALVAPHPDTLSLVNSWLEDRGVPRSSVSMTLGGNWLMLTGVPVPQANDILGASYQLYKHAESNDTVLRTIGYSLPSALHGHIQTVAPTTYFGPPRTRRRSILPRGLDEEWEGAGLDGPVAVLQSRKDPVTPEFLRILYKTRYYTPEAVDRNAIGTAGYMKQTPSPDDLKTFMEKFRTEAADATYSVKVVNGGLYDPNNPGVEANFNLQLAEVMTYPTPNIYYSTGGTSGADTYISWLKFVLEEQESIPQTISTTYGGLEYTFDPAYAQSLCKKFAELGLRGVSVLFSTGDWGVGEGNCLVRDRNGRARVQFLPEFPASCPWVTSVGGTTGRDPEIAARLSGGGFSNLFELPEYQRIAVPSYLQKIGSMHNGLYNRTSRGYPDISAQALGFPIIYKGKLWEIHGTSGSSPIAAGVISMLNDYLISDGKPPRGFLNPWLYGDGLEGLNDITIGRNPGCGTNGFPALPGWDPVTGLGTPDFDKMEDSIAYPPRPWPSPTSTSP